MNMMCIIILHNKRLVRNCKIQVSVPLKENHHSFFLSASEVSSAAASFNSFSNSLAADWKLLTVLPSSLPTSGNLAGPEEDK